MVDLLWCGSTAVCGLHAVQFLDLQTTSKVLEYQYVHTSKSQNNANSHLAGCSAPEDLIRADASIKFATSADVIADAVIMILPLNLLRRLQINAQQKFGLAMIFSLGTIIIAFAFARLAQVTKATSNAAKDPTTIADGPVLLSMWSHIESSVSIIVATLPAFRYLLNGKIGRTQGRSNTRDRSDGRSAGQVADQSKTRRVLSGQWGGSSSRNMSHRDEGRLADNDWGSETELRPIQGIEKRVEYSLSSAPMTQKR